MNKSIMLCLTTCIAGLCFSSLVLAAQPNATPPVGLQVTSTYIHATSETSNNAQTVVSEINSKCNNQVKMVIAVPLNLPPIMGTNSFRLAGTQLLYICEQPSNTTADNN